MFNSVPVIFILGCFILVRGFKLSDDGKKLQVNDADFKFESETTIPSSDTYNKTQHVEKQNCLENTTTLCAEVESYPHDQIENIINPNYDNYFDNKYPIQLDGRIDDELKMCESVFEYIRPRAGYTADNIFKLIVNMGMNYTQEIRIEKCIQKDSTCNYVNDVEGYKSYCEQAYTYQRLLSIDNSFTILSIDLFKIPSGCICATKQLK